MSMPALLSLFDHPTGRCGRTASVSHETNRSFISSLVSMESGCRAGQILFLPPTHLKWLRYSVRSVLQITITKAFHGESNRIAEFPWSYGDRWSGSVQPAYVSLFPLSFSLFFSPFSFFFLYFSPFILLPHFSLASLGWFWTLAKMRLDFIG